MLEMVIEAALEKHRKTSWEERGAIPAGKQGHADFRKVTAGHSWIIGY